MPSLYCPPPGSTDGPCLTPCHHADCEATRSRAHCPCKACGKDIGYGTGYYEVTGGLTHAYCLGYDDRPPDVTGLPAIDMGD